MNKIGIIGLGYVGLSLAMAACDKNEVVGFDTSNQRIDLLKAKKSYIEDVNSQVLIHNINNGKFKPTANEQDLGNLDIYVICVPTPLDSNRDPDLSFILSACEVIGRNLAKPALIINESTSYPGTLRQLIQTRIKEVCGFDNYYAIAPERVDPGRKDYDIYETPRLISGINEESIDKALDFYSTFCSNLVKVDSPEIAETAKLFENTFRQVNIALVNELATICHVLDIPVRKVLEAADTKPYGYMKFSPEPGVGGHCIPVDPTYLSYIARLNGVAASFIDLANRVNLKMPTYIIERIKTDLGNLDRKKILIVGVSYKPDISDVRETPAARLFEILVEEGAQVNWFDPIVETWKPGKVESVSKQSYDAIIVQVLHKNVSKSDIEEGSSYIFDCTGNIPTAVQL